MSVRCVGEQQREEEFYKKRGVPVPKSVCGTLSGDIVSNTACYTALCACYIVTAVFRSYNSNIIFVNKVNRIYDSIAMDLQSTVRRLFTARPYLGSLLSSFLPVVTEEVRRLLLAMLSKSSPLDVLPCSRLKSCSDVFAAVIAKLANQSMQTGKFPASYKQAQVMPLLKKAGLDSPSPGYYRSISNLTTVSEVLERLLLTRLHPLRSDQRTSASTSLPTGRVTPLKLHCWKFLMDSTRLPTTSRSLF